VKRKPVSTLHAIAHAQHRVRVTPQTTQPDSPQVPDAITPLDNAVTLRRSRKPPTRHTATARTSEQALDTRQQQQQQHCNCKQRVNATSDTHAEQQDDVRQPSRRVDTQPSASQASTHTTTKAQRLRAAATRRCCTSNPTCHETAPQSLLKLLRIARVTPLLCDYCR
jgi:hypothetical protein